MKNSQEELKLKRKRLQQNRNQQSNLEDIIKKLEADLIFGSENYITKKKEIFEYRDALTTAKAGEELWLKRIQMIEESGVLSGEELLEKCDGVLSFGKRELSTKYCVEWGVHQSDNYICLFKGGELLRDTLYRIGGMNHPKLNSDKYFLLLKYVETFYDKEILEMSNSIKSKHLSGHWCILDINGNEKIVFESFASPYLKKNSCIYSLDGIYYNIETGEKYGKHKGSIESKNSLFLENADGNVKQIDKVSGLTTIIN